MNKQEFEEKVERTIEGAATHMEERIDKAMTKAEQKIEAAADRFDKSVNRAAETKTGKQIIFFRKPVDSRCTFHRRFCFSALSIHDLGNRLFLRRGIGRSFPHNRSNYFQRLRSIYV